MIDVSGSELIGDTRLNFTVHKTTRLANLPRIEATADATADTLKAYNVSP